ncbi:MAG: dihydropteroate synthase [Halobacteriovoraceae bacterium]|nr:dihydropteroate synthase [Halobacteriovoraceae bacterium]
MFTYSQTNVYMMGVINITPNSFSDGGLYLDQSRLKQQIQNLEEVGCDIFDFGAESTAPFNQAITFQEEQRRLKQYLYPILEEKEFKRLSLDTYHLESIEDFCNDWKFSELIWNDVSGCFDKKTCDFLKSHPEVSYIYSHNLCESREACAKHMDYVDENWTWDKMVGFFEKFLEKYQKEGLKNKVYLDPCFGFSKSRKQNHELLKNFSSLLKAFSRYPFVLGISRKSFLRFGNKEKQDPRLLLETEILQSMFIQQILNQLADQQNYDLIVRLHDSSVYNAWKIYFEHFRQ